MIRLLIVLLLLFGSGFGGPSPLAGPAGVYAAQNPPPVRVTSRGPAEKISPGYMQIFVTEQNRNYLEGSACTGFRSVQRVQTSKRWETKCELILVIMVAVVASTGNLSSQNQIRADPAYTIEREPCPDVAG